MQGGKSSGGNGGNVEINGGQSIGGNGDGGDITISAGTKNGSGTDGEIEFFTSGTSAMSITTAQDINVKQSIIFHSPTEGIVYTSMGTVTQATDHNTNVTVNSMAGVITLASVSLASGAEAQFQVTNSAAQTGSLILLTVDTPDIGTSTDDSVIIAQVAQKGSGVFKVALKNVGDSATDTTARKINFLIINPSV